MKLRTHHLVCMILLLSALRAADGSVVLAGGYGFGGHDIGLRLCQTCASAWTAARLNDRSPARHGRGGNLYLPPRAFTAVDAFESNLPNGSLAAFRTAWTMRPPAAQSAAVHSVTSFGI